MKPAPRNVACVSRARERTESLLGPAVVVSLVGETDLPFPHVFVDPGRSYDFQALQHTQCVIASKPGVATGRVIAEVYAQAERDGFCSGFPYVVDVERKQVAHVWSISPLKYRPHDPGSRTWTACFG